MFVIQKLIVWIQRQIEHLLLFLLHPCLNSKIKETIKSDQDILREKGYISLSEQFSISYWKLSFFLKPNIKLNNIPYHSILKGNKISLCYNSVEELLEASLSVFVWACCLKPIEGSAYSRYERGLLQCF